MINLISEISKNQDFYGNKIWRDSDSESKKLGDLGRHVMKMYLPPLIADQLPGGYLAKGKKKGTRRPRTRERVKQAGVGTQYRTGAQEIMRNFGIKIQPMDVDIQEGYMEWEKKRALETLLTERGILSEYSRTYMKK